MQKASWGGFSQVWLRNWTWASGGFPLLPLYLECVFSCPRSCPRTQAWDKNVLMRWSGLGMWLTPVKASKCKLLRFWPAGTENYQSWGCPWQASYVPGLSQPAILQSAVICLFLQWLPALQLKGPVSDFTGEALPGFSYLISQPCVPQPLRC